MVLVSEKMDYLFYTLSKRFLYMLIDLPKVTYTVLVSEMGSYDHTLCKGGLEPCVELRMTLDS